MTPPSDELRRRVWEERIAAHTREIYFARLAASYKRLDRALGVATALLTSSTVVTLLFETLSVNPLYPASLAALAGILLGVLRPGESSSAMASHSVAWGGLHGRLDDLWVQMESGRVDHNAVRSGLAQVRELEQMIDRQVAGERERKKLLSEALDQAEALAS